MDLQAILSHGTLLLNLSPVLSAPGLPRWAVVRQNEVLDEIEAVVVNLKSSEI